MEVMSTSHHGSPADDRPYRIGDLSRLLALPPSAIRYYEEQGLVEPDKNWQNNYREYQPADGCRILAGKVYRSMGFTVDETRRLVTESDHRAIETAFEKRRDEVDREIGRLQRLRRTLDELRADCLRVPHDLEAPRVWNRPAYYRIGGGSNNLVDLDDARAAVARRWLGYLPATRPSFAIPQGAWAGTEPFTYNWGYALKDDDFQALGEVFSAPMEYHPAVPCLWTVVEKDDLDEFVLGHFRVLTEALTREGRAAAGPALGFTMEIVHEGGRERVRFGISIPFIDIL